MKLPFGMSRFPGVTVRAIFEGTTRGLRALLLLPALVFAAPTTGRAAMHEVTVYSFVTDDGKKLPAPTEGRRTPCVVAHGGYVETGDTAPNEHGAAVQTVAQLIGAALTSNHYTPSPSEAPPPAIVIVFQWGCIAPNLVALEGDRIVAFPNRLTLLELVGGRALKNADLPSERDAIFGAATDERYFVIVSACDFTASAERKAKRLLWRTQMSVPRAGLQADDAMPLLLAAGTALFGRDTPLPRRIGLKVDGHLIPEFGAR